MGAEYLLSDTTVLCDSANVYRKIVGRFRDGVTNNFRIDSLGSITFVGLNATNSIMTGVSDLSPDKACRLTYVLYLNGVIVPTAGTPIDFVNPNKTKGISISRGIYNMRYGDYYEVWVKSDTDNTTVTVYTLMLTFICDR